MRDGAGEARGSVAGPSIALVPAFGDVDVTTTPRLRRAIDALIDGGCKRIVLNMAEATYVDSAGMGMIFHEIRHMREHGGLLSLTNVSPSVMRALRIARVVDLVPVSAQGSRPQVPALDPSAMPLWRTTVWIDPDNLGASRERVASLLSRMDLSSDDLFDLNLATGEAMGNAIDHTDDRCALVTVACYPDRAVVDVTDCGCGFELSPDDDTPEVGEGDERGRGIKLMRLLADSVSIVRRQQGGTCVRIVKLFRP